MIKLNGKELYQWDTGRTVSVEDEDSVDEVHFANKHDVAYTVKVEDPTAVPIPNKLLKMGRPILAYIFVKDDEQEETYTQKRRCFQVLARPKPDNYIDDEEELAPTLRSLEQRIAAIEELLSSGEDNQIMTSKGGKATWD